MCIPPVVTRQWPNGRFPVATNTRNNRRTVLFVVFYTVRVVTKESLWVSVYPSIVARQWIGKQFPPAKEELVEASISALSVSYQKKIGD
jgi:hypothetical protein